LYQIHPSLDAAQNPEFTVIISRVITFQNLTGVYAAAVTPLKHDFSPDADALPGLLEFLAQRGCHGTLLFGTTGEGPSFSPAERMEILKVALQIRQVRPEFRLMLGTGPPSLEETIELTRAAFDLGADGVVVLPPYYYRKVSDDGLFTWFSMVIQRAVPSGGALLGYHIPPVSGVALSLDLLSRLKDAYPDRFAGIKDSSADLQHAHEFGGRFGGDLLIMNGTDRLLSQALRAGASGCITALGNLFSPDLRRVWDAHQRGEIDETAQSRLNAARAVSEKYPPAPPLLKLLLSRWHGFPLWPVRPPLVPTPPETAEKALAEIDPLRDV
jgi:4-hydroxy-tetrahydrodipicolinate synthase